MSEEKPRKVKPISPIQFSCAVEPEIQKIIESNGEHKDLSIQRIIDYNENGIVDLQILNETEHLIANFRIEKAPHDQRFSCYQCIAQTIEPFKLEKKLAIVKWPEDIAGKCEPILKKFETLLKECKVPEHTGPIIQGDIPLNSDHGEKNAESSEPQSLKASISQADNPRVAQVQNAYTSEIQGSNRSEESINDSEVIPDPSPEPTTPGQL